MFLYLKRRWYKLTHWETWHYLVKYIPIMPVWLWYCIRARSFWFFTPSNPSLTFGGFEGERKKEMYEKLPPGSYPESIFITAGCCFEEVLQLLSGRSMAFPLAVKPDAGMMGFMFRPVSCIEQLKHYHQFMPVDYIIQHLVTYPLEVSVFYYRHPSHLQGKITGFIRKEFLSVTGDGISTLSELIHRYPRVQFRLEEMEMKHSSHLHTVIPKGEIYFLSYALNLSRGGKLVSLEHEKDERLLQVFDELSHYTGDFYYGRYDIKCASVEALKSGKDFSILEYNGCGAEPHHAYGNGHTLWQAYGIFLHHWKVLYRISRYNHRQGIHHWNFIRGLKFMLKAKRHFRKLKRLDMSYEV